MKSKPTTTAKNEKLVGRTDLLLLDLSIIEVQEGFNGRKTFDRDELDKLKASIKERGVRTPLLVKKIRGEEKYALIDGERRLIVCRELVAEGVPLPRIPATLFAGSDTDAIVDMLIRNDGVSLSPVEEAEVMYRLSSYGLTPKEISVKTSRTQAYISALKILHEVAPHRIKKLILDKQITSTLVMQTIRDFKDNPEEGFAHIEKAVSEQKVAGKKTTSKDVQKAANKYNSYSELKKLFKKNEEATVREEAKPVMNFLLDILNNRVSAADIQKFFFQ